MYHTRRRGKEFANNFGPKLKLLKSPPPPPFFWCVFAQPFFVFRKSFNQVETETEWVQQIMRTQKQAIFPQMGNMAGSSLQKFLSSIFLLKIRYYFKQDSQNFFYISYHSWLGKSTYYQPPF